MTTQIIKKLWLEFAVTGALMACSAQALAEPAARPSLLDPSDVSTHSARVCELRSTRTAGLPVRRRIRRTDCRKTPNRETT
jgi:hypothetical protein